MKNITKSLLALAGASLILAQPLFAGTQLDQDSANLSMRVGIFASISGLEDITLTTDSIDGSEGAQYSGKDSFRLKSNSAVSVTVQGSELVNGENVITPSYSLDGAGTFFDTAAGVHNTEHSVGVSAKLGDVADQEAGSYSGKLTITVSAL